jgi:trk system potassium uptake protein TrkA
VRVVIAGGSGIEKQLANALAGQKFDVVVINRDARACEDIALTAQAALVLCGDVTDRKTLEDARLRGADIFVAITGDDNMNIVAGQMAKYNYGVRKVIAMITDESKAKRFFGIDFLISTPHLVLKTFEVISAVPHAMPVLISKTPTQAVEVVVPSDSRGALKLSALYEDFPRDKCVVAALCRNGKFVTPHSETVIMPGDTVTVVGKDVRAISELTEKLLKPFSA